MMKLSMGKRAVAIAIGVIAFDCLGASSSSAALIATFNGGVAEENSWRSAAGITALEDFEGFPIGTQIPNLPALGVEFDTLAGGGFPQIYNHFEANSPYGTQHLGNFPNGINAINRFDDIVLNVMSGKQITALGFWNGDGQADTLVASVFDSNMGLLGSIGAFKGTFAGFLSDVPIASVVFDGNTGDGWNHLDGLQTNSMRLVAVPVPATLPLFVPGLIMIGLFLYRRNWR